MQIGQAVDTRRRAGTGTSGHPAVWRAPLLAAAILLSGLAGPWSGAQETPKRVRRHVRPVEPQVLVLTGGTLVDGTGAPPLHGAAVVVRGDRIVAAGEAGAVEVPPGAGVIDVRGGTILPGVWNAHVHSGYRETRLEAWAHAGVTTVCDLGGAPLYALVDTLALNPQLARVVAAGSFITVPNGYPIVPWGVTNVVPVTDPAQARNAANQLIDQGADVVKIALESGADFGMFIPSLSLTEAAAVVEAAHARGVRVAAHITTSYDLPKTLDAGVDDIAHMVVDFPSDALLARAARHGVVWIPTLELWHVVAADHQSRAVVNLWKLRESGGTVALGTDFGGYDAPFQLGMPMIEMELMREAGMTPMEIVVAATRNAAFAGGRLADLGTVEVGKIADLIVVAGDPVQDIEAMANVRLVMRSGVVIRNEGS